MGQVGNDTDIVCRYDGQAGAAGITLEDPSAEGEFMAKLYRELRKKGVPTYAVPRLVRLTEK
jgi:hypothetical protein